MSLLRIFANQIEKVLDKNPLIAPCCPQTQLPYNVTRYAKIFSVIRNKLGNAD